MSFHYYTVVYQGDGLEDLKGHNHSFNAEGKMLSAVGCYNHQVALIWFIS